MLKRGRGRPKKNSSDNLTDVNAKVQEMVIFSDREVPSSNELPEFFKIYKPALSLETMKIPPDFIKKFGGNVPTICTLKRPSGVSWQVDMNTNDDDWFFENGWPEFVQENSLKDGDFLTFCYAGNSTFYVKLFSPNGCTKSDDDTNRTNGKPSANMQEDGASEPENSKNNRVVGRNLRPRSSMARKSVSGNPSFSRIVWQSYFRKGCLLVPMDFWKSYMRKGGKSSRMVTLWVNNDAWNVGLATEGDRVQFSKGCTQFMRDNSVKVGNLCIFELIDRNDLAFKVTVYR